jgi:hypothetical protein
MPPTTRPAVPMSLIVDIEYGDMLSSRLWSLDSDLLFIPRDRVDVPSLVFGWTQAKAHCPDGIDQAVEPEWRGRRCFPRHFVRTRGPSEAG